MRTAGGAPPSHALCASLPARGARPARQGVRVGVVRVAGRGSRRPVTRAPPRSRPVSAREPVRVPCGPGRGTPEREEQPEVWDLRKETPGDGDIWGRGCSVQEGTIPYPLCGNRAAPYVRTGPCNIWVDNGLHALILFRWTKGLYTIPANLPAQKTPAEKAHLKPPMLRASLHWGLTPSSAQHGCYYATINFT